jgi:RND family efflux transporter MFP subunit
MDPTITSPVPMKDSRGMDYVPVYEEEAAPASPLPEHAPVSLDIQGLQRSGVQTATVKAGRLGLAVRAVGLVIPDERLVTHVHTKVSGWVEELYVNFTGQWVAKGQPLLSLYSPELLASQEEYLRARHLARKLAGSPAGPAAEQLQQAARARLLFFDVPEDFLNALESTGTVSRVVTLRAPVSGYVLAKNTFPGQRVEPGMELYTVADLHRLWVEGEFYEQEAAGLTLGLKARVNLPYQPEQELQGTISYVYPTLDAQSRTLRARVEVANPEGLLKPGMYAHLEVEMAPMAGLLVPDSAVLATGRQKLVFVEEKLGYFVPRPVQVVRESGGLALVSQGLVEGEKVAVSSTFLLDSESRLRAFFPRS